jgi:hypothetical protein
MRAAFKLDFEINHFTNLAVQDTFLSDFIGLETRYAFSQTSDHR